METPTQTLEGFYFLEGGGEMGKLIREKDWSKTSLGHPKNWPQSLCTSVAIMLNNPFGMYIAWGNDYIQLYNDGYRPILGSTKHPQALGISSQETFAEIWHIIGPMFQGVMQGKAVGFPDFMLPLNRNGYVEECFFDFSYSPIKMEDGQIGGILATVIETTKKKKAEEALRASEERFRTMAENIPNLAWMANADGFIYWYNKKWYEYTGTTETEMKGWGWQSVHDPIELPKVMDKWLHSIENAQPFEMVFPLKSADGKFRQFLTKVVPVYNSDGKLEQWFGANTDITMQIAGEQSIKESEERFRTMAEDADILIATSNETGNATYFNQAWIDFTGRNLHELINYGWADLIHEEDRQHFLDIYFAAFEKKQSWTGEFRMLNKNGEYRWLLAKGPARFREDGSFAGYISSSIDIMDRKIAEKAASENANNLRNTILQAPVAMCILRGPNFVVELANEKMFELLGKEKMQLMDQPIFEAIPEARGQGFEELLNGVFKTGKSYSSSSVPATIYRNGKLETIYADSLYEAYHESDGSISGILAVSIDVTAQVLARQKIEEVVAERTKDLAEANMQLQKSNQELAQFAYIASHDLQEPLRKISTFSQMLENSLGNEVDERSKKFFDKINIAAARMNNLIRDVLSYSELGRESHAFVEVDLNKIVEGIQNDYELLIEQKGASIVHGNLPTLNAIPLQMSQLFGNMISNALKFTTPEMPPIIKIIVMQLTDEELKSNPQLQQDNAYYKIVVSDNGIGFKSEYVDQIFNIFQRLHRKSEYDGTGIGLAMCKKICQNHHGEINAFGSSENGAVFNILLPVKQVKSNDLLKS